MSTHINIHNVDNAEISFATSVGATLRVHQADGMHTDIDLYPADTHGFTDRLPAAAIIAMLKASIEEWEQEQESE